MSRIGVIRLRGTIGMKKDVKDTLKMLRLNSKNQCIVIKNNPANVGMIKKAKDYITWGEINEKTFMELLKQRGRIVGKKKLTEEYIKEKLNISVDQFIKEFFDLKRELKHIPGIKLSFRLKPPVGGFERKGIKIPFSLGGAIGYRKDKINDLILKML